MRKRFSFLLSFCVLLSFLFLEVSAAAQSSEIQYTVRSYRSTLYQKGCKVYSTGPANASHIDIPGQPPVDVFNYSGDITEAEFQNKKSEFRQELVDWVEQLQPLTTNVLSCYMTDDNYRLFTKEDYLLLKYFNLSENFNGTKNIQKEGIPFVVTGDGTGNFVLTVDKSIVGYHTARIYIPAERKYEVHDVLIEKYMFIYKLPNSKTPSMPSGSNEFYTASSIQEGLEHCKAHADLSEPILVDVDKTCELSLSGTITDALILDIEYGTTSSNASASQSDLKTTAVQNNTVDTEQKNKTGEQENSSSDATSIVEETEIVDESIVHDVSHTGSNSASKPDSQETLPQSEKQLSKSAVVILVICCIVGLAALVLLFVFLNKRGILQKLINVHNKNN